jgi:hypothetical protein
MSGAVARLDAHPEEPPKRVLEPVERIAEVLFGLIMVLTFTGSLSVAEAGRDDVRAMLIGALGCNFAWGVIDGLLYLMGCVAERGGALRSYHSVLEAPNAAAARRAIAGALPPVVASLLEPAELDELRERLRKLPVPPKKARLHADDWLGSLGVFLLVFLATFPVAIPFIVMQSTAPAMRVSNAIAVAMLFVAGYAYGNVVGRSPILFGFSMVLVGAVLVAFTIALGG